MATASSVTGTGAGSCLKIGQAGGPNDTLAVDRLIGTRIVASGWITLSGTTGTVTLPVTLPGNFNSTFSTATTSTDYICKVASFNSSTATFVSSMATSSGVHTFGVTGGNNATIFWEVIRISKATVDSYPTAV